MSPRIPPPHVRLISPEIARKPTIVLFRMGFDTLDIAHAKKEKEAVIYKRLNDALNRGAETREFEKSLMA